MRAGLAWRLRASKDSYRAPLTHLSWVNIKGDWYQSGLPVICVPLARLRPDLHIEYCLEAMQPRAHDLAIWDLAMDAIVVIAASAGGLEPLRRIIAALPDHCASSIFVVMHIGANRSVLPALLTRPGFPASFPKNGTPIEPGRIYVAPPDQHMLLELGCIRLSRGPKANHTRPAADPLFRSAAEAYGSRVVGIVLSGGDSDGARGLRAIKERGGTSFVQLPEDATSPSMPMMAIALDHPDACLRVADIAQRVAALCSRGSIQPPDEKPIVEAATSAPAIGVMNTSLTEPAADPDVSGQPPRGPETHGP